MYSDYDYITYDCGIMSSVVIEREGRGRERGEGRREGIYLVAYLIVILSEDECVGGGGGNYKVVMLELQIGKNYLLDNHET